MCSRNVNSSYVAVAFEAEGARATPVLWYGRVHYYVSHQFNGRLHQFAAIRFYDWVGTAHESTAAAPGGQKRKPKPKTCEQAMAARYGLEPAAQLSFERFPVVTQHLTGRSMQDLVPVQRLLFRWIPCLTDQAAATAEQDAALAAAGHVNGLLASATVAVCPIPTRMHA